MKITMLGCGTSVGIPALGRAGWGTCDPQNPKNRRQRCAILIQTKSTTILIDAGPDIRNQLLPMHISKLDAVLITHTHSDHVAGMDDLRVFYWPDQNKIKLFVSGMSAKARGYDESLLDGFDAEFAMPDKLLELSTESDTVLCY